MEAPDYFIVVYHILADDHARAEETALALSIEQSVEMPPDAVPEQARHSIAEVAELKQIEENRWLVKVRFSSSTVDGDPLQLLNVLFGNTSLKAGIRLMDVDDEILNAILPGPSFGISGIRNQLDVNNRPLSCTALKPIGFSATEFGEFAEAFAGGGIDLIKDDHGLFNQQSAPFKDRVQTVTRAIRKGEERSGKRTLYFPNITGSADQMKIRFREAAEAGADGVMILPHLSGFSVMQELARSRELPMMAHPAFAGSYVLSPDHGVAPKLLFGKLWKAFGADAAVYPNAGGRFSFTQEQVADINYTCRSVNGSFVSILPVLGGGIQRGNVKRWADVYEYDTAFLIGGSLYQHPDGVEAATREFQQELEHHV